MNSNHNDENHRKMKIPPDLYNASGANVNELPKEQKDEVISIFKVEFLPNQS